MKGYYKDPNATKETIDKDGWLHTGDLARMDEEGYIYIVDRKKNMIVRGGENVYPAEIENVLHEHPAILEVAVIGIPHAELGQDQKAFVVLKEGYDTKAEEIVQFCRKNLASYKVPRKVEFIDALPRNAAGKVLNHVLRERQ
jgi:acyl-CoA synthetase (AMP-forming)/AMP-acid ligase II